MTAIRILLVEDQTIVRQGLRRLLETDPSLDVVGEADSVATAVLAAKQVKPDVILMDLRLGAESGLDATKAILADNPDAKALVLTAYDDFPMIEAAAAAGVLGYAPKQIGFSELREAITTVKDGGRYIHPSLANSLLQGIRHHAISRSTPKSSLTDEERQLLRLMAGGLSLADIADRVFLSERTIRRHVQSILYKLEVTDRIQAVATAIRQGWI